MRSSNQRSRRKPLQLELPKPKQWGGARKGAGRKSAGRRGVPHTLRAAHQGRHPLHVTLRVREGLPSLRGDKAIFLALRGAIAAGQQRAFRIVHFSVQSNHLHLIVEAHDRAALSRGMQGLAIRMAKAVNRALGGRGQVFEDRYHAHALRTPRETRAALLYVLQNWAKHGRGGAYDPCSSALWFEGWTEPPPEPQTNPSSKPPGEPPPEPVVAPPRTWLAAVGWRRCGLLRPGERPARLAMAVAA